MNTCWTLIIVGIILTVISAVVLYGGFYALPVWATAIALTIGVICLVLGIVLLIALYVKAKMGH
jgi:hypothetical protein